MSPDFHIGISYQECIPIEYIEELTHTVATPGLQIRTESRETSMYATMEWALPTLVIAYLSKSYFEAFLKEAGKDHYQLVKKGLLALFIRLFGKKPENRKERRSQLFSAIVQLNEDRSLKFVFPEGASVEQYQQSLEIMHSLVLQHYEKYPNDPITEMATRLSTPSHSLYIEYKISDSNWLLIDPLIEAQKAHKAQSEHNKTN